MKKKILSAILVLIMVVSLIPSINVSAAGFTLAQLQERFPHGRFWNRVGLAGNNPNGTTGKPCPDHNNVGTCNVSQGHSARQCMGFVIQLGVLAYPGTNPYNWASGAKDLSNLKPGDIVQLPSHYIFITSVNGDSVTFSDCNRTNGQLKNSPNACKIYWNNSATKSMIKTHISYLAQGGVQKVFSAPYALGGGSTPAPTPAPSKPTITMSKTNYSPNETVTFSWNACSNTSWYDVFIDGKQVGNSNTQGTKTSFSTKLDVGTHTAYVSAVNAAKGIQATPSSAVTFKVNKPVTVTYYDEDGVTEVDKKTVDYGSSIDRATVNKPTKEGHTFNGWNTLTNITSDQKQIASYTIDTYTVIFQDQNGNRLKSQSIKYLQSATPPEPQNIPNGYTFVEWDNQDYLQVKKPLIIKQVIAWGNPDFLVASGIDSATWNDEQGGYDLVVRLKGHPAKNARGKIIASLKTGTTSSGLAEKMVSVSVTNFQKLKQPNSSIDYDTKYQVFVPYRGIVQKAEIEVVGILEDTTTNTSDNTGSPITLRATRKIDLNEQWSDWQVENPGTGHSFVEGPVTRWREKNRSTTTSTSTSLSGWTQYGTATTSYGSWSNWTTTPASNTTTQKVETRTTYRIYCFKCPTCGTQDPYYGKCSANANHYLEQSTSWREMWITGDMVAVWNGQPYNSVKSVLWTAPGNSNRWYWEPNAVWERREYRTQPIIKTYNYEKWSDWSEWKYNTSVPSQTTNKTVETEQVYRYKDTVSTQTFYHYKRYKYLNMSDGSYRYTYTPAFVTDVLGYPGEWEYYRVPNNQLSVLGTDGEVTIYKSENGEQWYAANVNNFGDFTEYMLNETREDTTGKEMSVSGELPNSPNKKATVMVYKGNNTDPTSSQLEYITQITLGENGEYELSFRPKEDPSRTTGDFFVVIGIEGGTAPILVKTIPAPKPVFEVVFIDEDDKEITKEMVYKGESATLSKAPEKEGYTFVGWDKAVNNVQSDMVVQTKYEKNKYSVIFIDWDNEVFDIKTFEHGDELIYPEIIKKDQGRVLSGWGDFDSEDIIPIVTDNMVVTAKYNMEKYFVTFYDTDGTVLESQEVDYGKEVVYPDTIPTKESKTFRFWSDELSASYITDDLNLYPVFGYATTVSAPTIKSTTTNKNGTETVSVSCDTASSKIYYIKSKITDIEEYDNFEQFEYDEDGNLTNGTLYNSPLILNKNEFVSFVAVKDNMNASDILAIDYEVANYISNEAKAETVIKLINNLGKNPSEAKVKKAREEYNKLTSEQKALILTDVFAKLKAIEKKIAESKKPKVTKITIKQGNKTVNSKTITVKKSKKSITLKTVVSGKNLTAKLKKVSWTSTKKKIATINNKGKVKFKKIGTVTIKAKVGGKMAKVKIKIKKK